MKYQKRFVMEEGKNGIPAEEFEQLMSEYLPVTAEQLRNIATFDAEKQEYVWAKLGCGNYAPTHFWNFFTRSNKSRGTSRWGAYFDSGGGL